MVTSFISICLSRLFFFAFQIKMKNNVVTVVQVLLDFDENTMLDLCFDEDSHHS